MTSLQNQMNEMICRAKKHGKLLLIIVEAAILLLVSISYWRQVHNLVCYEYGEDQLRQYTAWEYEACFGGEIDESRNEGLYVIPLVMRLRIPMTGWYSPCEMVQRSRQKFKIQQNRKGIFRFMCYSIYIAKNNKKG